MAFSLTIHVSPKSEIKKRKIGFILILERFQSSSKLKQGKKKKKSSDYYIGLAK